jgi:hypothetical protein
MKEFKMKQILLTILGASIANILTFILYQGFVQSYFGKNAREEITRWFNSMSKHMQKENK